MHHTHTHTAWSYPKLVPRRSALRPSLPGQVRGRSPRVESACSQGSEKPVDTTAKTAPGFQDEQANEGKERRGWWPGSQRRSQPRTGPQAGARCRERALLRGARAFKGGCRPAFLVSWVEQFWVVANSEAWPWEWVAEAEVAGGTC